MSRRHAAPRARRGLVPDVVDGWSRQPWSVRVLRGFLGVTFVYAGLNKLADPGFLHPGAPTYIGTELQGFAHGSPIRPIMLLLGHLPKLVGIGTALTELAVGIGTLLGVAAIAFAAIGMGLNVMLWLSASWHVHPYFLGSDSIYAVAWAALLLSLLDTRRRARVAAAVPAKGRAARRGGTYDPGRREVLRAVTVALGAVALGGVANAVKGRPAAGVSQAIGAATGGGGGSSGAAAGSGGSGAAGGSSGASAGAKALAKLDSITVGGAVPLANGPDSPAWLIRLQQQEVVCYNAVCTHAGCLVEWDQGNKLLVCPCHGSVFNPAKGGVVESGPAPAPLQQYKVSIDGTTGEVVQA